MLVVFLSGTFPAWKASRLDPLDVLSGQNEKNGSKTMMKLTSWMPTTLGLSIRSSFETTKISNDFLSCGISLMLFGSIQMMSAGFQDTLVGSIQDDQTWDAQVFIMPDGELQVIEWSVNNSATHEILIESPLGSVYDSDNLVRGLSLVGLSSYDSGMRTVSLTSGELPDSSSDIPEVMLDEGAMNFLGWKVGEIQTIQVNGDDIDVKITGITRGEISRTVYFELDDLSSIMGVNATSIYLQLPDGVVVDSQLVKYPREW